MLCETALGSPSPIDEARRAAPRDAAYLAATMSDIDQQSPPPSGARWRPDLLYSALLFAIAAVAVVVAVRYTGILTGAYGWPTALFFVIFGLFTITMGFPHPGFGHVSFDRVAQVASILVLGPVDAAWINGLASLIYPWKRLWQGESLQNVVTASLHNAGLMSLVVLLGGSLYAYLGGPVPPVELDLQTAGLLLLLMLSMQLVNDLGMLVIMRLRGRDASQLINLFTTGVELWSVLIAVLLAVVYGRLESSVFALLLIVLGLGMLVLRRYAEMRNRLEALVSERTEELRLKSLELERQATHDKLTGLHNRRYADGFLQREIEQVRRSSRDFTVALADVDHFKQINDRFSHAIGDQVLRRVADILVSRCRQTDVVARYGGEEFLLCFPDTNVEFAEQICGQLRLAVENADWSDVVGPAGGRFVITMSFGIAQAAPDSRVATLLGAADTRLYRAKSRGRNRVVA